MRQISDKRHVRCMGRLEAVLDATTEETQIVPSHVPHSMQSCTAKQLMKQQAEDVDLSNFKERQEKKRLRKMPLKMKAYRQRYGESGLEWVERVETTPDPPLSRWKLAPSGADPDPEEFTSSKVIEIAKVSTI